jgi:hypothetical protein
MGHCRISSSPPPPRSSQNPNSAQNIATPPSFQNIPTPHHLTTQMHKTSLFPAPQGNLACQETRSLDVDRVCDIPALAAIHRF